MTVPLSAIVQVSSHSHVPVMLALVSTAPVGIVNVVEYV